MFAKSRSVLNGSKQLVRSRSSDNLPTSQSQMNIHMMSHTLTIREVRVMREANRRAYIFSHLFIIYSLSIYTD